MNFSNILSRLGFWATFIGSVIVVLFIYGIHIDDSKTELQQKRIALKQKEHELLRCNQDNILKSEKIQELNRTITNQRNVLSKLAFNISQKEELISKLDNTVRELENKPPPEPYHQYGNGNGKLTVYSECNNCPSILVTVDGEDWGILKYYFSGEPRCGQEGTITRVVLAGKHHIQGKDSNNRTWNYYIIVREDNCNFWHFSY